MTTMRTLTIPIPYLGHDLVFDVDYHWDGKYVPATRTDPEEYPVLEINSAVLVEINGEVPTPQEVLLHSDARLVDQVELINRIIERDAEEYRHGDAADRDDAINTDTRV